jgi:transcriptional regulator with XRE-family HTH domain
MTLTPSAVALGDHIKKSGVSQSSLAKTLGVSQPAVSAWLSGGSRPEPHLREAIEILTGIASGGWDTDEERALIARVRGVSSIGIDPNDIADAAAVAP